MVSGGARAVRPRAAAAAPEAGAPGLGHAPSVQALGETAAALNAARPVVAQRALAGRLAMPVVQRKLNWSGHEIKPVSDGKDVVPPRLAELRDAEKTYYVRDDWDLSYTKPIHLLDGTKKYLLGETHHSGKWEAETAKWRTSPRWPRACT